MYFETVASAIQWLKQEQTNDSTLNLEYVSIGGDEGATSLAEALKTNTFLTTLKLRNNIGATGATSLAEALKTNTFLTTLKLRDNIGDKGVTSLAKALKANTSLTTLDLESSNIGDKGVASLAEALKTNTSLTVLYLWGNSIYNESVQAIIQVLQDNFFITIIKCINNRTIDTLLARNKAAQAKFATILSSLTTAEQIEHPDEALANYEAIRDQLAVEANNYPPLFIQKYSAPFYISLGKKYHHYGLVDEALNCFYQAYPFIGADIRLMMMESMLIQTHSSDTSLDDLCLLWLLAQGLPFVLRQQSPLTIVIRMFNQLSEGKIVIHERALANKERLFGLFDEKRKTNKQDSAMRLIEENLSIILKK